MGPFENFTSGAGRGLTLLAEAFGLLQRAREKNTQARAELAAATEGTGHAAIDKSLAKLGQVGKALEEAGLHAKGGREDFEEYLRSIYATAALTGGGDSPAPPTPAPQAEPRQGKEGWRTNRAHPEALDAIKRVGWPKNSQGKVSARGLLYDKDGREIGDHSRPLRAVNPDDGLHPAPDLKEPWRSDPEMTTTWHLEGEVTSALRNSQEDEMVLYINIPPCGASPAFDPKRCDANTPHLIRKGQTLHVHAALENGGYFRKSYRGTGEAIA